MATTIDRQLIRSKSLTHDSFRRQQRWGFIFILPALLFVSIFFLIPLLLTAWMSLHDWPLLGQTRFLGFDNFTAVFNDKQFWTSLLFTIKYTVFVTPSIFLPAFGLALLVNRSFNGVGVFRTAYFLPVVIGLSVTCLLWNWLLNDQVGIINTLLRAVGIISGPKLWFTQYDTALTAIILIIVWKTTGFTMMLLVVGMQAIPEELYQAAMVDGANYLSRLRFITLPLLRRTFALALVLSVIGSFLAFEPFTILTAGRPQNQTITIVYWIYKNAFVYFKLGYAATLSIILLVILAAVSAVQLYLLRGRVEY
jgi:multiple sugar transport system permease protein